MADNQEKPKTVHGGRNLIILGVSVGVITLITTAVSLYIYRATGDIYLDRSRPGYISEGEKRNDEKDVGEEFSSDGEINTEVIDKYIEELDIIESRIDAHQSDFSNEQLSDDALGIYIEQDEEKPDEY